MLVLSILPVPSDCEPFVATTTRPGLTNPSNYSSTECFGIHLGDPQSANLGDGNGAVNQTIELRADFGNSGIGTCGESLAGGNHFRYDVSPHNMQCS